MNEKDMANLYRSLTDSRDSFMQGRARASRSQPRQRMNERDRELRECMRNR